jgi:uncharacterized protein
MKNVINWFEIPVKDFERAKEFYCQILQINMYTQKMGSCMMGFFPMEDPAVGGAIAKGEGYIPGSNGTRIYLNGGDDLSVVLLRVEPAGGRVLVPKTLITPEIGYYALFLDTEGNKLALHSR